jgi:hypothetical protein
MGSQGNQHGAGTLDCGRTVVCVSSCGPWPVSKEYDQPRVSAGRATDSSGVLNVPPRGMQTVHPLSPSPTAETLGWSYFLSKIRPTQWSLLPDWSWFGCRFVRCPRVCAFALVSFLRVLEGCWRSQLVFAPEYPFSFAEF